MKKKPKKPSDDVSSEPESGTVREDPYDATQPTQAGDDKTGPADMAGENPDKLRTGRQSKNRGRKGQ
jgi:hypothetical protein